MANRVLGLLGGSLLLLVVGVVGKLLYSSDETVSMGSILLVIVGAMGMNIAWVLYKVLQRLEPLEQERKGIAALQDEVAEVQRHVEKQAVLLRALFALLSERQVPTEAELLDRFRRCEAERASAPPKKCSECGRAVNLRHHRCLYCGNAYQVQSAFELLEIGDWPDVPLYPTGPASTGPIQVQPTLAGPAADSDVRRA